MGGHHGSKEALALVQAGTVLVPAGHKGGVDHGDALAFKRSASLYEQVTARNAELLGPKMVRDKLALLLETEDRDPRVAYPRQPTKFRTSSSVSAIASPVAMYHAKISGKMPVRSSRSIGASWRRTSSTIGSRAAHERQAPTGPR